MDRTELESILKKAISGDQIACDVLYTEYAQPLYGYIYSRIGNRLDAEDILQDVFIKIFRNLKSIKIGPDGVRPYFYTITRNTIIDFYRKKIPEDTSEDLNFIPYEGNTAFEDMMVKESKIELNKILDLLPADAREIVILRYISGLSNKEISKIVGKKEDSLRQTESRSLRFLKSKLHKKNEK
ncbi:MAG: RNA polymerase sigma factor [bacterium]